MAKNVMSDLRELECQHDLVRLYSPADTRQIYRSAGRLPGAMDHDLLAFFRESNGASILDYCFLGCKNPRIPDIRANMMQLWGQNDWLAGEIVPFVTTSAGEVFGYLYDQVFFGGHPVVYMSHCMSQSALLISSSVGSFFAGFVKDVSLVLSRNPDAVQVDIRGWPLDLKSWINRDPMLASAYNTGRFAKYYTSNPLFCQQVQEISSSPEKKPDSNNRNGAKH